MMGAVSFAELHCKSNFSFLQGASHPEELVRTAHALGYAAIAITDECSLAGVVRAHEAAQGLDIKLIIGAQFWLRNQQGDPLELLLLAPDRLAYGELSELITLGRRRAPKGDYQLHLDDLAGRVDNCLALWMPGDGDVNALVRQGQEVQGRVGRLWIALGLFLDGRDADRLADARRLAQHLALPVTAANAVLMHGRERKPLLDALTAIRLRQPVAALGTRLTPNAERHLRPLDALRRLYPGELLAESLNIADACHFSLDELRYEYPEELVPAGKTPASWLRELTYAGARWRWPQGAAHNPYKSEGAPIGGNCSRRRSCARNRDKSGDAPPESSPARSAANARSLGECEEAPSGVPAEVQAQIEHELALIAELNYEYYFLTVQDIVRFAREQGILCQGRGSAANSAVCYCLGVTEVDPSRQHLLFERFISRERREPPDIDVDFEHERREEVIQYIYRKYGRGRTALAATVITYRPRSALRDLGKALGLDLGFVDLLAKSMAWWDRRDQISERIAAVGADPQSPIMRNYAALLEQILGFPRHLSQHVGGFVISSGPLAQLVPIENAAMADRTVIQWDKNDLESLGLLKVDVLGLGMLTAIRKSLHLINAFRGWQGPRALTVAGIPKEQASTYQMLQKGDSIGVFQVESRAQMAMLPRLRPERFYDLVIEVAIVRPGPIQGDMVHPYLRRRQGLEPVEDCGEAVNLVLERTLGVPIFQEQVIELAMVAAGFSAGEADELRRAMAAWQRRGGLGKFERKLIDGMLARGHKEAFARRVFEQIKGFGEYGFPESHAASFALLVYISAWLKRNAPAAFYAGLLNSQPMGFYSPSQLVQDAARHGVKVLPADVQASGWDFRLEPSGEAPLELGCDTGSVVAQGCASVDEPSGICGQGPADRRNVNSGIDASWADELTSPCTAPRPSMGASPPSDRREAKVLAETVGLRVGLRRVKGLSEEAGLRIAAAQPFKDVDDLQARAALNSRELEFLARAGALSALSGHRYQAHWDAAGVDRPAAIWRAAEAVPSYRTDVALSAPQVGEDMKLDYRYLGLSLGPHPMSLLRDASALKRHVCAADLEQCRHGQFVRVAGLVTCRQRPGTATGVVFVTLEDETGNINVVVWSHLFDRFRATILQGQLLRVEGLLQREREVIHVIARRAFDASNLLQALSADGDSMNLSVRNFH